MPTKHLADVLRRLQNRAAEEGFASCTDRELLNRFVASRNEAAYELLVVRHGPMVLDICRRVLNDPHAAEDAFQATFLVLVRKAQTIRRGELLANWLYGVAQRTAARARVDTAKRRAREAAAPARPAVKDPLDGVTARDLLAILDQEMSRLPAQFRGPLIACHLEGKTRDEAAKEFGWSLATLARRLERGRDLLRARLTRRGLSLSAAMSVLLLSRQVGSAALPSPLVTSAVQAATLVAAGGDAVAVVSSRAVTLSEGVLKAMFATKLKTVMAIAMLAALACAGTDIAIRSTDANAQEKSDKAKVEQPRPAKGDEDAPKKVIEALRGKWSCESMEQMFGTSNKNLQTKKWEHKGLSMTLDAEKLVRQDGGDSETYKVTFDADKNPPRLTFRAGPNTYRYIYEVKGDTLRLCCFGVGEVNGVEVVEFPTQFSIEVDPKSPLFPRVEVWKRVKDKE